MSEVLNNVTPKERQFEVLVRTHIVDAYNPARATIMQINKGDFTQNDFPALQSLIRRQFESIADGDYCENNDDTYKYYIVQGTIAGDGWLNLTDVTWLCGEEVINAPDTKTVQPDMRKIYSAQLECLKGLVMELSEAVTSDEFEERAGYVYDICQNIMPLRYVDISKQSVPDCMKDYMPSYNLFKFGEFVVALEMGNDDTMTGKYIVGSDTVGFKTAESFDEVIAEVESMTDEFFRSKRIPHFYHRFAGREEDYTRTFDLGQYESFDKYLERMKADLEIALSEPSLDLE